MWAHPLRWVPLVRIVEECPELLFVCFRLSRVNALAEGFPVTRVSLLHG